MAGLYAGLDVSLELISVCAVDEEGRMVREAKVASEPDAIIRELRSTAGEHVRVGLEAGPLSQWLCFGLKDAGLPVVCIVTLRGGPSYWAETFCLGPTLCPTIDTDPK